MKKSLLALTGALALTFTLVAGPAAACDSHCDCAHGKEKAAAAKTAQAEKVSLEGTVVSFGCDKEAKKLGCTGAALMVGETRHLIKKGGKGAELVSKTKDTQKTVKVSGTKKGEFLTVSAYEIKG